MGPQGFYPDSQGGYHRRQGASWRGGFKKEKAEKLVKTNPGGKKGGGVNAKETVEQKKWEVSRRAGLTEEDPRGTIEEKKI